MFDALQRLSVICGHAGVGKTNLALHLANSLASQGKQVTLIDLDIVNPYFRSSDYNVALKEANIHLICPQFAGSTLDLPSLSGAVDGALDDSPHLIIDAGGDDIGSTVLGRFAPQMIEMGDYAMLYVINRYRISTQTPEDAVEQLEAIQRSSRLRATAIINNSHLGLLTTPQTILDAIPFANKVSELTNLPLVATTAPCFLQESDFGDASIFFVQCTVQNPWV